MFGLGPVSKRSFEVLDDMAMWSPSSSRHSAGNKQWVSVQKPLMPQLRGGGGRGPGTAAQDAAAVNLKKNLHNKLTFKAALDAGYLKVLNKELILEFQRQCEGEDGRSKLKDVERIDLRACYVCKLDEEAVLSCVRLRICNLSGCYLQEIGAFYGSINLLKLDLSNNQVMSPSHPPTNACMHACTQTP